MAGRGGMAAPDDGGRTRHGDKLQDGSRCVCEARATQAAGQAAPREPRGLRPRALRAQKGMCDTSRGGGPRRASAEYIYVRGSRVSGRPAARGSGICDLATRESREGGGGDESACGGVLGRRWESKTQHKSRTGGSRSR